MRSLLILALAASGCESDACEEQAPSFQLDLTASGDGVGSLVIDLSSGTARKREVFVLSGELADGMTSIAVEVEEAFIGDVLIRASTHAANDGVDAPLAEAMGSFAVTPDGCNRFALALAAASCVEAADEDTVALFPLNGDLTDATGAHVGVSQGDTSFDAGRCGDAIHFSNAPMVRGHGIVVDSPAFDLTEGSIDLWLRPRSFGRAQGVISRASIADVDGDFTLYVACDGTLVARLMDTFACSDPVVADQWSYVGVNFGAGGFELWVDGARAARSGEVGLFGTSCAVAVPCGGSSEAGLSGNDNPWILGASADDSEAGTGTPLSLPFRNGRIDAFRISDARRGF